MADSGRESERGADRPAVRDADDSLAFVAGREVAERSDHALAHLLVGLPVLPAPSVIEPALELLGEALLDLGPRQRLPGSHVDLAEAVDWLRGQAARRSDDLRRLERPPQRARIDRGHLLAGERFRELRRLCPPELVERRIGVSLEAALPVPVCLPVPDEEQLG